MNLADYLLTPELFGNLLDQLASPEPDSQLVGDAALSDASAVQILAAIRRAPSHVRTDDEPPRVLVRFIAAQTGIHIDRVRKRYKPGVLGGALLFVARHLWPAYEVWVGGCHPLAARLSLPGCIGWLRDERTLLRVLQEFAVPDPGAEELRQSASRFTLTDSGHYRWYESGRAAIHAGVVRKLNELLEDEMVLRIEDRYPLDSTEDKTRTKRVREGVVSRSWMPASGPHIPRQC